jgi:hypothetical protein
MNTITERANAISKSNGELVAKQSRFTANTRKAIWSLIADVYALGLASKQDDNVADYDALLSARGLKPAKADENEWLKVIQVSCGTHYERKGNKGLGWTPNSSITKYARALRFMETQGVDPADALAFIGKEADWVDSGKAISRRHLIGMIAADKIVHPAITRDRTKPDAIKAALQSAGNGVEVPFGASSRREYLRVFGYVEAGLFHPIGKVEGSEQTAKLDVHRAGMAILNATAA